MSDNTLLILGALGLGAFWLMTSRPVTSAGTTAPANTTQGDPYAAYLAGLQAGQANTPRDPGDTNNWTSGNTTALIGALGQIGGALVNSYAGNTSSSTPSGWVAPDWNA